MRALLELVFEEAEVSALKNHLNTRYPIRTHAATCGMLDDSFCAIRKDSVMGDRSGFFF